MVRTFHSVEAVSVIPFTCQRFTHASPHRSSCSHLAADLNFSRYWGRRLSWPGRSMRVQVLPCRRSGEKQRCESHPHTSYFCPPTVLNSPCHFWLCMEHCCQWWRSVSAWTFQTAAANTWKAQKEISKQTNKQTYISCPPPTGLPGSVSALTHPAEEQGFPRVTQPHQEHGGAHSLTGEEVLQKDCKHKPKDTHSVTDSQRIKGTCRPLAKNVW